MASYKSAPGMCIGPDYRLLMKPDLRLTSPCHDGDWSTGDIHVRAICLESVAGKLGKTPGAKHLNWPHRLPTVSTD